MLVDFCRSEAVKRGGPFNPIAQSGESIKSKSAPCKSFLKAKPHLKSKGSRSHFNNKVFSKFRGQMEHPSAYGGIIKLKVSRLLIKVKTLLKYKSIRNLF